MTFGQSGLNWLELFRAETDLLGLRKPGRKVAEGQMPAKTWEMCYSINVKATCSPLPLPSPGETGLGSGRALWMAPAEGLNFPPAWHSLPTLPALLLLSALLFLLF